MAVTLTTCLPCDGHFPEEETKAGEAKRPAQAPAAIGGYNLGFLTEVYLAPKSTPSDSLTTRNRNVQQMGIWQLPVRKSYSEKLQTVDSNPAAKFCLAQRVFLKMFEFITNF